MICVSLIEPDYKTCWKMLRHCQMAEIRLEQNNWCLEEVKNFFSTDFIPLIATCRSGKYSDTERLERLQTAIAANASYVDIEVDAEENYRNELIACAREFGCKVIVSHHNIVNTPPLAELKETIAECRQKGADIVKLATTAGSPSDAARILALYENEINLVALAMGDAGRITRLACLYLGAPFTYASWETGKESAAGQIPLNDMKSLQSLLV